MFVVGVVMLWFMVFVGIVMVLGFGGGVEIVVESYQDQCFSSIMCQQYDFSCGLVVVVLLLFYYYNYLVIEVDVFCGMFVLVDLDKVCWEGFLMFDMKCYFEFKGYWVDGFCFFIEMM